MKYDSQKTPIILGVSIILAVLVGVSLTIVELFNGLSLETKESQENLYGHQEADSSPEDTVELVVPTQNPQGTGVAVESNSSFKGNSYSHAPVNTEIPKYSNSVISNSRNARPESYHNHYPIDVFDRSDRDTTSLSSQSLTQSNFSSNSRTTNFNSSLDANNSLLNSVDSNSSSTQIDSNSTRLREQRQENSSDNDPLAEDLRF